ncbi:sigma-70 family RNA polymerase sigma factor [Aneurinibacillus migulanus]|uniref:sigma-70 family RNA polymerase sigma factor n=1 Tax=Aneurinibacillus migulanus TaxID=47500 RepID=UPI002E20AF61|nr:sigma-70 family RNA polymerase sigma factor [Aneurinibacillus migulanus]
MGGNDYVTYVRQAQQGDKDAFCQLIKQNEASLYRVARSILKSDSECLDAIQEAVLEAYIALNQLREPHYFKTWLIRIIIHKCNQFLKKNKKIISLGAMEEAVELPKMDDYFALREAIQQLEEKFRLVITLFYFEGFALHEIAELLGIPEGTVRSRLARARKKLAELLSEKQERRYPFS